MANHIVQDIAVVLRSLGDQILAKLPKKLDGATCAAACTMDSATGSKVWPSLRTSASIRSSVAFASAVRPLLSSQRGDSGRSRLHHSRMKMGSDVITTT